MKHLSENEYKLFEDILDQIDISSITSVDRDDQVMSELNRPKFDMDETNIDDFEHILEFTVGGLRRRTGKDARAKIIDDYKKFYKMLRYVLDANRFIAGYSDIVFYKYIGSNPNNTSIENIGELMIRNTEEEIDEFFATTTIRIRFSFNKRNITTPKAVYSFIRSLYTSINISLKRAFGNRAYINEFYENLDDNKNKIQLSNTSVPGIIEKNSQYREKFISWVKRLSTVA